MISPAILHGRCLWSAPAGAMMKLPKAKYDCAVDNNNN